MWIFVVNIYVLLKIGGPRRDVCLGVWFAGMVRGYGSGMVRRHGRTSSVARTPRPNCLPEA